MILDVEKKGWSNEGSGAGVITRKKDQLLVSFQIFRCFTGNFGKQVRCRREVVALYRRRLFLMMQFIYVNWDRLECSIAQTKHRKLLRTWPLFFHFQCRCQSKVWKQFRFSFLCLKMILELSLEIRVLWSLSFHILDEITFEFQISTAIEIFRDFKSHLYCCFQFSTIKFL